MKLSTTYSIGVLSRSQGINPHKLNNTVKFEIRAKIWVKSTWVVMVCLYNLWNDVYEMLMTCLRVGDAGGIIDSDPQVHQ